MLNLTVPVVPSDCAGIVPVKTLTDLAAVRLKEVQFVPSKLYSPTTGSTIAL